VSGPNGATLLKAGRVLVYYDLAKAARGELGASFRAFRIEDAALSLDLDADRELLERLKFLLAGGSGSAPLAASISGRDVSLRLASAGLGTATIKATEFALAPKGGEAEFSFAGEYRVDQGIVDIGSLQGPLSAAGSFAADLSRARMELGIAARARDFGLRTQRFELVYSKEGVELRKVRDQAPLDLAIALERAGGDLSAELRMEGFSPGSSLQASGRLAWLAPWLAASYSGRLAVELPGGDLRRMSYSAEAGGFLAGASPAGRIGASISAKGDYEGARIARARLEKGGSSLEYSGSLRFADLAPDGELGLSLSLRDGALPIEASVQVYGHRGEYALLAERLSAGDATFRDLSAVAALRGDQLDFEASILLPESESEAEEPGPAPSRFSGEALPAAGSEPILRLEGSASFGASPSADLSLSLESVDLGPLRGLLAAALGSEGLASTLAGLRMGGEVFASSDFERLSWTAPDLALVSSSLPGSYALLSLSGNLESVNVRKATISAAGREIEGRGRLDFARGAGLSFEAGFQLLGVPYSFQGTYAGGVLSASGDYGARLLATLGSGAIAASLRLAELPVPIGQATCLASLDAEGRFASPEDWSCSIASLSLDPAGEGSSALPRISVSGDFRPRGGQIWDLSIEDRHSSISGPATAEYALGAEPRGRLLGVLASKSSAERYDLDLGYQSGSLRGKVAFQASPLARLGSLPLAGSLDGGAEVDGPLDDPRLSFEARLRGAKYRDQPISGSARGSYAAGSLSLAAAEASYLGNELKLRSATFSFLDAASTLALSFAGRLRGQRLTFDLEARGSSRAAGARSLGDHARDYEASGILSALRLGELSSERLPFSASLDRDGARLDAGGSGELSAYYGFDGAFELSSRSPFPLRMEASGRISGKEIEATARGIELDLPALSFFVPPEALRFLSGTASGELAAHGLLADPEIRGSLEAKGVALSIPGWIGDTLGPFDLPIALEGRSITARNPAVPVGKAWVDFEAGASIDHWLPAGLAASARSAPGGLVRVDATVTGIEIDGDASFDLRMELRGDTVFLGGDIDLAKASVLVSPEVWASNAGKAGPPQRRAAFIAVDFDVGLSRGVQVLFPSRDFPVVSGYADRASELKIAYDQGANDLLLKGTVALRGGDVFYIQRNFFLKSAQLVFNESIDRFDPRVTVLAELRDRSDTGPVLITLRADNAPITSFQPSLSSDPAMTEGQIAALLGQNLLGLESGEDLDIRRAAISGAEFIPRFNVTKAFESRVREALGLDIFYLRTQLIQRWLIDISDPSVAAGDAGTEAGARSDPLASYLDETSLYAGKYLGESIFVHGSARLSENDDPLVPSSVLRLDLELGAEFDTPFGLLQWTVNPSSPESLYIKDQSISLSWKLSY